MAPTPRGELRSAGLWRAWLAGTGCSGLILVCCPLCPFRLQERYGTRPDPVHQSRQLVCGSGRGLSGPAQDLRQKRPGLLL